MNVDHLSTSNSKDLANKLEQMHVVNEALPQPRELPWPFFWLFRRTADELTHSHILAYLLDPRRPHGLGTRFLSDFLARLGIETTIADESGITVETEVGLNRRIADIVMDLGDSVLVIENKVYSSEGHRQTHDLESEVSEDPRYRDRPTHYVYLTPQGRPAKNPTFTPISYATVAELLRSLTLDNLRSLPAKTVVLLTDLLDHIEGEFTLGKGSWGFSDRSKLYIEYRSDIDQLSKAFQDDLSNIARAAEGPAIASMTDEHWTYAVKSGFQQLYRQTWLSPKLLVHFETWINADTLSRHELPFMLDVEGTRKEELLGLFDQDVVTQRSIADIESQYRPQKRSYAVAHKTYRLKPDYSNLKAVIEVAYKEHAFLARVVDSALARL